ncbi:hypothetical protein BH11MYX3_BH11MYX3_21540 [soil metagenome]
MVDKLWVCIDCGARQLADGTCTACSHEMTLDTRDEKVRELMRDVEDRLTRQRESRYRFVGVVIGMTVIFGLWAVPGYWGLRGRLYPGLPIFADQWMFMVLIGLGLSKLLVKHVGRKRFPYLDINLKIVE